MKQKQCIKAFQYLQKTMKNTTLFNIPYIGIYNIQLYNINEWQG